MDIIKVLSSWDETRKKIALLEERLKKYKNIVSKEMNKKDVDYISTGSFTVTRRRTTRTTLSKDNVPADIWKEYCTRSSYDVYSLIKN